MIKSVQEIEELGKCQFNNFITERLVKREKSLFDPIRKNKLALFKTPSNKLATKEKQQISSLKSDCSLFSRLFISSQTRNENLDQFFKLENHACPPSISQNGKLRLPTKNSDPVDCISTSTVQSPPSGGSVKTFEDYTNNIFIPYLKTHIISYHIISYIFIYPRIFRVAWCS